METISSDWEDYKSQLASAVKLGQSMDLSSEQIAERASQVGDFLAQRIDPKNPQQQVLQELWESADEDEQQALAGIIIKLVSDGQVH